ncbi:syntabulin isoform X2 [Eleginops maclovinus]|uniref:syntabulin isoform X2 n=1 Tax=Eleginops maclovinus TaxID=56733 RepID=UPI00307FED20
MGPFQEYEEKKSPEKGSPRSRIPRLVLHPFPPKDKGSPLSDSPLSEEEGKEGDVSSDHSKRTISTTSFCSGSEQSAHGSPALPERKTKVKRVRVMAEWSGEPRSGPRHKRELRSAMKARGSEADFSSSSSTGSLKNRESLTSNSAGKRAPTRSRGSYIRPLPVFKPAGSPKANRDSELYAPYRTPPRAVSSTTTTNSSSCNSSPTSRRALLGHYHSCGDNHGIKPPNPEQYLTPLQQKEVAIRHLKTKLLESENRVRDRETEVQELNAQLGRMREDWIEEECHRVEAQLSLKEARKEIKQLRQVVETMKSSLMEKDKGIQKYFIDINIQNRKLESLLQSMEMAQSGTNLQDENTLDFICDIPDNQGKKTVGEEEGGMEMGTQGAEAMADSGLLVNDEMANSADILEQIFMSTAVDFSQDSSGKLGAGAESGPGVSALTEDGQFIDESTESAPPNTVSTTVTISSSITSLHNTEDKETLTDLSPISPELQALLLQLLHFHGVTAGETAMVASSNLLALPYLPTPTSTTPEIPELTPPPPSMPTPAPPESPDTFTDSGMCCSEPTESHRFMDELDFCIGEEEPLSSGLDVVGKRYWSNSFLVDLVAVAAPVLPTVAWLYSRHGVDGSAPVYNIAALIRGCCIMGLRSLRRIPHRPDA